MRRIRVLLLLVALLINSNFIFAGPAQAGKSPKATVEFFQNFLSNSKSTYISDMKKLRISFETSTEIKENNIDQAKLIWKQNNQVKIIKLGDNRNYWGNFNCPTERPSCIDVDKGPKFQVGEITSIKEIVANDNSYLREIDLIVSLGLVELLNRESYLNASKVIVEETNAITALKRQYSIDRMKLDDGYSEDRKVTPAIKALKRALKSQANFEKAFVAALKFEYNRQRLDDLANLPFSTIDSLKSFNSAVSVTRLSLDADSVASNYTFNEASRINRSCGNTFTKEFKFKDMFSKVAQVYFDATGRNLSLN